MNIAIYKAATLYPMTVDELKLHLRIEYTSTDEDILLQKLLYAAVEDAESHTRRALLTQTWDYYLDEFPSEDYIKLPFGNLQSVTHIKYTDSDGTQTTMTATTEYLVETNGDQCGKIVLPYGETWPSFTAYTTHPVVIRFVCGWTSAANVPFRIKAAIKMICADFYSNREARVFSTSSSSYITNPAVSALLANYRLWDEF